MALLPVDEALDRMLDGVRALDSEDVPIAAAAGRVLASALSARRTQPPFDASAMDGYAVRAADLANPPARLRLIGASAAGKRYAGRLGPGEAVRIFTGAPMPQGADAILIQENAEADGDVVEARESVEPGRHIRRAGLDFEQGDVLLDAGRVLDPAALSLAGAAGYGRLPVVRRPRIAIVATGDELVPPGTEPGPDQIVASNNLSVAALARADGAEIVDLGIVGDDRAAIAGAIRAALGEAADIIVTLGGASVGEHDLVREVLVGEGMELAFWKIAMRPGKPLMFGRFGGTRVLGLPGNPVSTFVCSHLFLRPLVARFSGRTYLPELRSAILAQPMKANDHRQDYVRASVISGQDGLMASPFDVQDSSMLSTLAASNALIIREPGAPASAAGERCRVLMLR
ncbi:gephyrin-like molybdotransferase Glp [Nitratireductor thuwali]|uniref:Molybdopterin molybdenumtransferase n=1 Tax=Nitratireductor thuwali TaxID=2267699 RepID=A0ABY5MN94_9HYPH|nr:Molybdopterin molybdenumtransferase [Nitratireductor thuwali]